MACDQELITADETVLSIVREGKAGETPTFGNLAVTLGTLSTSASEAVGTELLTLSATTITDGTTMNTGEILKVTDDSTV